MFIDYLYRTISGRLFLKLLLKSGFFSLSAKFMRTPLSRFMIKPYIRKHNIDMTPFEGEKYRTFADFFARRREPVASETEDGAFISPCDGHLSVYPVNDHMLIPMKGSHYELRDFIPDGRAEYFRDGLCLVFRLKADDYHHFSAFDNMSLRETHYVPGTLHSVQPVSVEQYPVYRKNRRWWSIVDTENFGTVVQVAVGAMLVGGISFRNETGDIRKGEEVGNFELAGSTIVIIFDRSTRDSFLLEHDVQEALKEEKEVKVLMGMRIGRAMP